MIGKTSLPPVVVAVVIVVVSMPSIRLWKPAPFSFSCSIKPPGNPRERSNLSSFQTMIQYPCSLGMDIEWLFPTLPLRSIGYYLAYTRTSTIRALIRLANAARMANSEIEFRKLISSFFMVFGIGNGIQINQIPLAIVPVQSFSLMRIVSDILI